MNVGCGEARDNSKALDAVVQRPGQDHRPEGPWSQRPRSLWPTSNCVKGMPIGAKVTLRGDRMWEFLDRFFNVALPRVRDFRGINPNGFDGHGNYAVGVKEQLIFPEIEYDKIDKIRGMDIVFTTTAQNDEEARELLTLHRRSLCQIRGRRVCMAKKSMILKQQRGSKYSTRNYNRCKICGRPHAYLRNYRHLPYLLPRAGLQGPDPRRAQSQLVSAKRRLAPQT